MASVKEWLLPMVEKYWLKDGLKVERKFQYHPSPDTKNDNKKTIFKGVILF
tara:strand:+ start:1225 stop:1377 length:153 start_codon:yes stop_codon:yes gene_type:complete